MKILAISLFPLFLATACVTTDRVRHTPMISSPEPSCTEWCGHARSGVYNLEYDVWAQHRREDIHRGWYSQQEVATASYPRRGANLSVWKWDDSETSIYIDLTQMEGLLICDYDNLVPVSLAFVTGDKTQRIRTEMQIDDNLSRVYFLEPASKWLRLLSDENELHVRIHGECGSGGNYRFNIEGEVHPDFF